jgi:hypothetical protein
MGKRLSGKNQQLRFAPKTIRMAMSLWLWDGKGYQEFQESTYYLLPSPQYLRKLKEEFRMKDGEDPKVYCRFKDERLRGKESAGMIGHLMADEIKLKSDIAYNCRNKEIIGFVGNKGSLNLREEFANLLTSPERASDDTKVPAVYANQWRFRSIHNKTHNAEFFFNSGSITKDELLRQFMHVVTCYEMSGVKVMGIVPDAGGPNSGLLKLLRKDEKVEGNWPSTACLSLVNHMSLERRISIWHCSTHGAKAMRNSLYRSQESGTKEFPTQRWCQLWVGANFRHL